MWVSSCRVTEACSSWFSSNRWSSSFSLISLLTLASNSST